MGVRKLYSSMQTEDAKNAHSGPQTWYRSLRPVELPPFCEQGLHAVGSERDAIIFTLHRLACYSVGIGEESEVVSKL